MTSIASKYPYGWIRDLPDQRDLLYSAPTHILSALPSKVDNRSNCAPVGDQGLIGSCTGCSIAEALEFEQKKQGLAQTALSRLFIYYNERAMEGTVNSDSGAMIRDGIKSVAKQGACPESMWPYDTSKFAVKPSANCYQSALQHKALSYQSIAHTNLSQLKGCLASGYGFVFGITVYESFESDQVAQTGIVPMPAHHEQVLGGHALFACGYDDAHQWFIVQNSWGTSFGDQGFIYIPYLYLTSRSLASDFWTIRSTQ